MILKKPNSQSEKGFSIVEMVVVVGIIGILTAITTMSLRAPKKYTAENQALFLVDMIREAQQRSLSQKNIMRVEINSSDRVITLINENEAATANDDVVIKTLNYVDENVFIGIVPTNMTSAPSELSPVTPITFAASVQPNSMSDQVATMRFRSNGTVLNAGSNAVGSGAIPTGATIYVWTKRESDTSTTPTEANILRALTVLGSSGSTKMWKCAVTASNQCSTWTR